MARVFISTAPFGSPNPFPIELLNSNNVDFETNQLGRKLTSNELATMIGDAEVLIAGTETISEEVLRSAKNLKLISRVGIGLDSVDLLAAERLGIKVCYTPDAPAPAVAELTIGHMLCLLRHTHVANNQLHAGQWKRHFGRRIAEVTIGVIGVGRIGGRVLRRLAAFGSPRILVNDLSAKSNVADQLKLEWVDKETIYRESDIVTVHLPLTSITKNMIRAEQLQLMKPDAAIINTSRGGIVNEADLARLMKEGHLSGAAIDVFDVEPYFGELAEIERCLLTAHMGSMSLDCRSRMEIEATEEAVRFVTGKPLERVVPSEEYETRRIGVN